MMSLAAGLVGLVLGFFLGRYARRAPRPTQPPRATAPVPDYGLNQQLDVIRNARFGSFRTPHTTHGRDTDEQGSG